MRKPFLLALALCSAGLSGCVVRTAADVVTAPVRLVSSGVDAATTSQSEADEKRGRELRQREEELGKLNRRYQGQLDQCSKGDERACFRARETYSEIQILLRNNPALAEPAPLPD